MPTVGFLQLPLWHEALRAQLRRCGQEELLRAPVLNAEDSGDGWKNLPPDDFFRFVQVGLHFEGIRSLEQSTDIVITSDASLALKRVLKMPTGTTGVRGALGGLSPLLELFHGDCFQERPTRMLCIADGVANFILNEMEHQERTLEAAVQEAQWQNIAPGNPTRHLHGLVAQERVALLAFVLFGIRLDPDQIFVEGIAKLEQKDIQLARSLDFSLRLLGVIERRETGIEAWVRPCLIPCRYLLSQVRGGMESAYVMRPTTDPIVFSGPGGGKETQTQGILRDWTLFSQRGSFGYPSPEPVFILPHEEIVSGYYVRIAVLNAAATLAQITQVFAEFGIEIQKLMQTGRQLDVAEPDGLVSEVVFFTRPVREGTVSAALQRIRDDVKLAGVKCCYRFESPSARKA